MYEILLIRDTEVGNYEEYANGGARAKILQKTSRHKAFNHGGCHKAKDVDPMAL